MAPDRRAVLAEAELGARELVDGRIESTGEPVDEARRVRRPRDLGRVAHPRGIASGRLGRGGGADVVPGVREQMGELALHARGHEIPRASARGHREGVRATPRVDQRPTHVVRRGPYDRRSEPKLREQQRVAGRRTLRHRREPDGVLAAHEVIGEVQQIDRDAGRQKWIFHQRKHRVQLGPREIERLEVFEAARPQHAAFERLSPRRELWKEALGVDPGERRERLLARSAHAVGGNALAISPTWSRACCAW